MPFFIDGDFYPSLVVRSPEEDPPGVTGLQLPLAQWKAHPSVVIENETGTFRAGWIQVLARNNVKATYDNLGTHRCELKIGCKTPIADRRTDRHVSPPWYSSGVSSQGHLYVPQAVGVNPGRVVLHPYMSDAPFDAFAWRCPHPEHVPLIEVNYELSFRTWLVVQQVPPAAPHAFRAVLHNFMYTINRRFVVDITRPVGSRALSSASSHAPGIEVYSPPLPVPSCAWQAAVANTSIQQDWSIVQIVRRA